MPRKCGGKTEDLVADGPDVSHITREAMMRSNPWQRDYAIFDMYNDGYVYVHRTKDIHKCFRIQHSHNEPTHQLTQVSDAPPRFICMHNMLHGEELTFNYNLYDEDAAYAKVNKPESPEPDDLALSFSLGSQDSSVRPSQDSPFATSQRSQQSDLRLIQESSPCVGRFSQNENDSGDDK